MDAFEKARLKHAKNLERRMRAVVPLTTPADEQVVFIETPKEREPITAAIIEVKVTLPTGEFDFRLVKASVMQNANPSKLNKNEFRNRIMEGLRPVLGGLSEG